MTRFTVAAFALIVLLAGRPSLRGQDGSLTEKQKIEALIKHLQGLKGAKFVRNSKEYDAETAAKFLRAKWEVDEAKIKTAKDFVEKRASVSSTSGKPYLIRFTDGKETKSGQYLLGELKKLEKPSADKDKP